MLGGIEKRDLLNWLNTKLFRFDFLYVLFDRHNYIFLE